MSTSVRKAARILLCLGGLGLGGLASGCSPEEIVAGTAVTTVLGASSPTHEIQQIYYLGVFDPQEQLPPTVYRLRVHGQTSFISFAKFASGWVPAPLIDSLTASVDFKDETASAVAVDQGASESLATLTTGRRLMMFGPEGFLEAPANHRLVIVMGSSPEAFFGAIDSALGTIGEARFAQQSSQLDRALFEALSALQEERAALSKLEAASAAQAQP